MHIPHCDAHADDCSSAKSGATESSEGRRQPGSEEGHVEHICSATACGLDVTSEGKGARLKRPRGLQPS